MDEFKKAQKNLKNDMIFLCILELIICCGFLMIDGELNIFSIVFSVFLFIGYILSKSGSKLAGIIGIIFGFLMILTILDGDLIDFLLGLFVAKHSINYTKLGC